MFQECVRSDEVGWSEEIRDGPQMDMNRNVSDRVPKKVKWFGHVGKKHLTIRIYESHMEKVPQEFVWEVGWDKKTYAVRSRLRRRT